MTTNRIPLVMPAAVSRPSSLAPLRLFASWGEEKPPIDRKEIELRVIKSISSHDKIEVNQVLEEWISGLPLKLFALMIFFSRQVKIESHLMNDLGLDSLDHVEIIVAVEDEFGIMIEDVDTEKIFTVNDIVDQVIKKLDVVDLRQNPGHKHPKSLEFGRSQDFPFC